MINFYITSTFIFILGCCFGSFLSVAIGRTLKQQKGIFLGTSACPKCKHKLSPWDLIPIFSWIFHKGRCAYCHKPISIEYPALELITGLLFLTNYTSLLAPSQFFDFAENPANQLFFWPKLIFLCLTSLSLLSICFSDLKTQTIPNIFLSLWILLCIPAFLLTPIGFSASLISRLIALVIAIFFFGGQYILSKGRWLGSGDIWIAIGMGLLLGWEKLLLAIVLSYLIGSIVAIILLLCKKKKVKQAIAFGPFLVMGTLISLYFGNQIISWYLSTLII